MQNVCDGRAAIDGGKLVEGWEVDSDLGFLKGLGVVGFTELGKPLEEVFR